MVLLLGREGYAVKGAEAPEEAMRILDAGDVSLVVLDLNFTIDTSGKEGLKLLEQIRKRFVDLPVILITGWASIELAVRGMKLGANDFINKPWSNEYLLQSVKTLLTLHEEKPASVSRKKLDSLYRFEHIIGEDPAMLSILETVGRVAGTDASVLIMGESGTGKELIAEAVHQNSRRHARPFVKVNLGGISSTLFESEMFGHVRGAFTDARYDRVGRFEMGNKGTVFLDEIGELDMGSQVKLLRVLQDRTYEVLGSSRTKTVDVRVICATNKHLPEMVRLGRFREDLLYRINLITVHLPPLRERPGDIPLLVEHFLRNLRVNYERPELRVKADAMRWMKGLPLPGNIRQLKNLVERTVLVSRKDELSIDDFMTQVDVQVSGDAVEEKWPEPGSVTLEQMEIAMIRRAMDFHKGRITRVARALGITRSALYRRLEKFNIPFDETAD